MNIHRKLLILAINDLLEKKLISLDAPPVADGDGHVITTLLGRTSAINWHDVGWGELRVSVWWDYQHDKHPQAKPTYPKRTMDAIASGRASASMLEHQERFVTSIPLTKPQHYSQFVGAMASGWLERATTKHLQGEPPNDRLFDTYTRRDIKPILEDLPDPIPNGYAATGKFFC